MRYFIKSWMFFVWLLVLASCNKSLHLEEEFACQRSDLKGVLEEVSDFKKTFSIELPKHWNTKLYYDNFQSEIFTADTIKVLDESYIMALSMINAKIDVNNLFKEKVHTVTQSEGLVTVKDGFINFKGNKAYFNFGKGINNGKELHVFQCYVKLHEETYFLVKTEIYGSENMDARLCESIQIMNSIKFIGL